MSYRRKSGLVLVVGTLGGVSALTGCTSTSQIDTAFSDLSAPQTEQSPAQPTPAVSDNTVAAPVPTTSQATQTPTPAIDAPVTTTPPGTRPTPGGGFIAMGTERPPSPNQMTDAERDALLAQMQALQAASEGSGSDAAAAQRRITDIQQDVSAYEAEVLRRIETGQP